MTDLVLFSAVKGTSTSSVDGEVLKATRELMRSEGLTYTAAFKALLASDVALARRYHASHRRELPEDALARPLADRGVGMARHHQGWDRFWKAYRAARP